MLMRKFKDTDSSQFGAQIEVSSKTQMILHKNGVWQGYPHSNRAVVNEHYCITSELQRYQAKGPGFES